MSPGSGTGGDAPRMGSGATKGSGCCAREPRSPPTCGGEPRRRPTGASSAHARIRRRRRRSGRSRPRTCGDSAAVRMRLRAACPRAQSRHKTARTGGCIPYRPGWVVRVRDARCGVAPAARTTRPGRSWRCGSNYSAGREVGEDRRRRRRVGRGGVASAAQPAWRPARPVPIPRTEVAAAPLGTEIAVVGGFVRTGANTGRADAYSPLRNRWRRLPDLPVTVDHAMAAGVAGRLYVVGGYGPGSVARNTAFAFHHGHWTPLPSMPAPRAAGGAAIVGGKLYVVGGVEAPGRLARDAFAFDFETARWTTFRGPRPREHLGAAALGGRVYVVAGRTGGLDTNQDIVEAFDPRSGRWRAIPRVPGSAAAPRRRRSADGCSRPEARSPEERSEPCTPTRRPHGGGRSCRGCGRRATVSAWSAGAAAPTRSRAARSPG